MKVKFFILIFLFSTKIFSFAEQSIFLDRPLVIASIAPYKFLIESIAENTVDILTIVPPNCDPHTYEPTPKHISKIQKSILWIRIGEPFETFYEKSLETSSFCRILDMRKNINLLSYSGCSHKHATHKYQNFDSHIWLSPKLLKLQASHIFNTLCELFPEHEELYKKNYISLIEKLNNVHKDIKKIFKQRKPSCIAVVHPAFAYFGQDYDITQISIENGLSIDPSLKDLKKILLSIKDQKIKTIFLQKNLSNKSGIVIAKKLNLNPIILDPYQENVIENLKYIATAFAQS